jgi:hypothetical protein
MVSYVIIYNLVDFTSVIRPNVFSLFAKVEHFRQTLAS